MLILSALLIWRCVIVKRADWADTVATSRSKSRLESPRGGAADAPVWRLNRSAQPGTVPTERVVQLSVSLSAENF